MATSDRNFYDRHYFHVNSRNRDLGLAFGLGQYPNLATTDGFLTYRNGGKQHVIRASRELTDRADTKVGPVGIDVIKGLQSLRFRVDENEHGIAADLTFTGLHAPHVEPRQFIRNRARVLFDVMRFGQAGQVTGWIVTPDARFESPDGAPWFGYRDRSWGIRPNGEQEPPGIRESAAQNFLFLYIAASFDDFTLMLKLHELDSGKRPWEQAALVWHDPAKRPVSLGRIQHDLVLDGKSRTISGGVIRCPDARGGPMEIGVESMSFYTLESGTGYHDADTEWRHGMYHGPLAVQSRSYDIGRDNTPGAIDNAARFTYGAQTGYGLFQHLIMGRYSPFNVDGPGPWTGTSDPEP